MVLQRACWVLQACSGARHEWSPECAQLVVGCKKRATLRLVRRHWPQGLSTPLCTLCRLRTFPEASELGSSKQWRAQGRTGPSRVRVVHDGGVWLGEGLGAEPTDDVPCSHAVVWVEGTGCGAAFVWCCVHAPSSMHSQACWLFWNVTAARPVGFCECSERSGRAVAGTRVLRPSPGGHLCAHRQQAGAEPGGRCCGCGAAGGGWAACTGGERALGLQGLQG